MNDENHSSKPARACGTTVAGIFEYFCLWLERLERFYEERDRRYEDRFKAQETAVAAALSASEKLTAAAFAASKEAISKAEAAQTSYNASHNDLTRKMDGQYKEMMPRPEAQAVFHSQEEKIDDIKKEVVSLKEYRSESGGRAIQSRDSREHNQWMIGAFIMTGSIVAALIIKFVH